MCSLSLQTRLRINLTCIDSAHYSLYVDSYTGLKILGTHHTKIFNLQSSNPVNITVLQSNSLWRFTNQFNMSGLGALFAVCWFADGFEDSGNTLYEKSSIFNLRAQSTLKYFKVMCCGITTGFNCAKFEIFVTDDKRYDNTSVRCRSWIPTHYNDFCYER